MKILSATDFSKTSYNAIEWVVKFLEEQGGGELEIINCIDNRGTTDVFQRSSSVLFQKAEEDMDQLVKMIDHYGKRTSITSIVTNENPKTAIAERAKSIKADLISIGTTGLTNLKDITIGSVTEYLATHSDIPVLAIPKEAKFVAIDKVVVGIDQERLNNPQSVFAIHDIFSSFYPSLHFAQVNNDENAKMRIKSEIKNYLKNFDIKKEVVLNTDTVSSSLQEFAKKIEAQALVLIHHKRNWIGRLFHYSVMKEQLFDIQIPVLIVKD